MNLLKKIFEKRRGRQIRRTREKYFDMFAGNQRIFLMGYGEHYAYKDAAGAVAE